MRTARDSLLETLQEAGIRLGDATLALRAGKTDHAQVYIREALRRIGTATNELREHPRREGD